MKSLSVIFLTVFCLAVNALEVKVTETGTLVQNGRHNAFPSICRFGDDLYFSFRSASGHRMVDGVLPIYKSEDEGRTWKKVAEIKGKGDLRDPRCALVNGKLVVYSGEVVHNADKSKSYVTRAYRMDEKDQFTEIPVNGLAKDSFFWGCLAYDGGYVATAYVPKNAQADLYRSKDGQNWQHWLTFPDKGNEVSMTVDATGELHCVMRTVDARTFRPFYYKVASDGKIARTIQLSEGMQGIMLQSVGDGFILAARHWSLGKLGAEDFRTDLFSMDKEGKLTLIQRLPSSDDNSYAFVSQLKNGKWYMVYYSQHNYSEKFRNTENGKNYNWMKMLGTHRPADICYAVIETIPAK